MKFVDKEIQADFDSIPKEKKEAYRKKILGIQNKILTVKEWRKQFRFSLPEFSNFAERLHDGEIFMLGEFVSVCESLKIHNNEGPIAYFDRDCIHVGIGISSKNPRDFELIEINKLIK